ncbi:MAG TPA: transglycosylase SLT domain-containing protein [Polyangia bacterium]|nr:transglycosylase SLT domain-containing protein [Polyangia bacterium]
MIALGIAVLALAAGEPKPKGAVADLARGYAAYRAGDYDAATRALGKAAGHGLRADDWAFFVLAESEFYGGSFRAAREHFSRAAHGKGRPAELAPARIADCDWALGDRAAAAKGYARVVAAATKKPSPFVDVAVARFHLAEVAAARNEAAGRKLYLALARDLPAHPLADEALRRASGAPAPEPPRVGREPTVAPKPPTADAGAPPPRDAGTAPDAAPAVAPVDELAPEDRLRRAATLTRDRHWDAALVELGKLSGPLPPALAARRDFQIGMTKFHMRRDYARAAELLLAAVPQLPADDAAEAAFHGARALSRVDRDDEAIAGYKKVVAQYPRSRWAAEAQYLSGWLDYNRGKFRESLPALQATLDHFGKSDFADEAAWCVAFAHLLLGEADAAFAGLARYAKLPATGMTASERAQQVAYWRARLHEKVGHADDARAGYRALVREAPLSFYGLLAAARLGGDEATKAPELPTKTITAAAPAHPERDPTVARALELLAAGMNVEAGAELQRDEKAVLARAGGDKALPWLFGLYARAGNFHRAYAVAEARDRGALDAAPTGAARAFWEAAYPRAYADLVEQYGPPAGDPDVWLYAIMRKESGFDPLDVSYADARGLLQMIPPTSARVAQQAKLPFAPDDLYDPETNVRLGAIYIGALYKKFGGQAPLAAGAYNAGPRAMAKWCDQHGNRPTDEFVELIAFTQTREYAKRVTSLYAHYRYLYGPSPYHIPLAIETKPRAGGPDY